MCYNTKNYTEQGGDNTVIGGTLTFENGGKIGGTGLAENQSPSTAGTVSALKDDLNSLIIKLKNANLMARDSFTVTTELASTVSGDYDTNKDEVSDVSYEDGVVTFTADLSAMKTFEPSDHAGWGEYKWLAIDIGTGLSSIVGLGYTSKDQPDYTLVEADATEATSYGCSAGHLVYFAKLDRIANNPETITISMAGYEPVNITFKVVSE